jgi:hypothetical protein
MPLLIDRHGGFRAARVAERVVEVGQVSLTTLINPRKTPERVGHKFDCGS